MNNDLWNNVKGYFTQKSALPRLMLINAAVFLLVAVINVFCMLFNVEDGNFLLKYMMLPSNLTILESRPWTVLTYMFLQQNFWHLFFNMLVLYFGGLIFMQFLSQKQLIGTYILGGLVGALFFVLAYNTFPAFEEVKQEASALGASAAVLAILVASATYKPQYPVNLLLIGQIKFKWVAILMVVIDFFSISSGNAGGHIAHLGGALWGFLYATMLKHNFDVLDIFKFKFLRKKTFTIHKNPNANASQRPLSDEEYNRRRAENQADIDAILDKVAKNGYANLTEKEKEFLFKNSNRPL